MRWAGAEALWKRWLRPKSGFVSRETRLADGKAEGAS